jgi:nucleoside-diphosphate-sugar epimerase
LQILGQCRHHTRAKHVRWRCKDRPIPHAIESDLDVFYHRSGGYGPADLAQGIIALLNAPRLRFCAYNVAAGMTATIGDLVQWAAEKAPGFRAEVTAPGEADIVGDASLRDGMWGAYDISRITSETGWKPRPVREALHAYMDWISAERRI